MKTTDLRTSTIETYRPYHGCEIKTRFALGDLVARAVADGMTVDDAATIQLVAIEKEYGKQHSVSWFRNCYLMATKLDPTARDLVLAVKGITQSKIIWLCTKSQEKVDSFVKNIARGRRVRWQHDGTRKKHTDRGGKLPKLSDGEYNRVVEFTLPILDLDDGIDKLREVLADMASHERGRAAVKAELVRAGLL